MNVLVTIPGSPRGSAGARLGHYEERFRATGIVPIYAWPRTQWRKLANRADGVLLTGGTDIAFSRYARKSSEAGPHPRAGPYDARRDGFELAVAQYAWERRMPTLGICRGAQLIAVSRGGTLLQHLPDSTDEAHGWSSVSGRVDDAMPCVHDVLLDDASRVAQILNRTRFSIPSYHHQAIATPGDDMCVIGWSPAGVPEAIEAEDPARWCVGIQGHMERTDTLDDLFAAFVNAARTRSHR